MAQQQADEIAALHRQEPDLTHKEIAARVGVSLHAVKRALRQEREKEQAALKQQEEEVRSLSQNAPIVKTSASSGSWEHRTSPGREESASSEKKTARRMMGSTRAHPDNELPLRNPSPDDLLKQEQYGQFDFQRFSRRRRRDAWDSDDEYDYNMEKVEKYKRILQLSKDIDWDELRRVAVLPHDGSREMRGLKFQALSDSALSTAVYCLTDRPDGSKLKPWEVSLWGVLMRGFWSVWPDYDTPMHMAIDFVNEKFDNNSLKLFDGNVQKLFRDIARQKMWPNNHFAGPQMAAAAKSIVQRLAGKSPPGSSPNDPTAMIAALGYLGPLPMGGGLGAFGPQCPTPPESEDEGEVAGDIAAFAIESVQGCGLGVVAKRNIHSGESILIESPQLDPDIDHMTIFRAAMLGDVQGGSTEKWFAEHYPVQVGGGAMNAALERSRPQATILIVQQVTASFEKLNEEKQSLVMALHDRYEAELGHKTPYGVFMTNAMAKGAGSSHGALFNVSSRFNHSCRPNAYRNYDPKAKCLRVYTCRDISAGEEIRIAYGEVLASRAERQAELQRAFAFQCSCEVCSLPSAASQTSDQRRVQMGALDERIPIEGAANARRGLKLVEEYEKLYLAEKLQLPALEQRFCYDGYQFAAALGDKKGAKAWIDRVVRADRIIESPDSDNLQKHLALQRDVTAHPVWGMQRR